MTMSEKQLGLNETCTDDFSYLDSLPTEVIHKIFRYLDTLVLHNSLSIVNKRFSEILTDENVWKTCYYEGLKEYCSISNTNFPVIQSLGLLRTATWKSIFDVHWRDIAVQCATQKAMWAGDIEKKLKIETSSPIFSTVDTVHFIANSHLFASGARDKSLKIWNIQSLTLPQVNIQKAHNGWIWDIKSCESDAFFTAAWDSTISQWKIKDGSCIKMKTNRVNHPALALACTHGLVVVGLNNGDLDLMDPRIASSKETTSFHAHKATITGLMLNGSNAISIAEDRTLSSLDLRAQNFIVQSKKIMGGKAIPRCIDSHRNIVYVGDTRGKLHVLDTAKHFEKIAAMNILQSSTIPSQITSVSAGLGIVVVACSDSTIRIIIPTNPPIKLQEIQLKSVPTSIEFKRKKLITGMTDGSVQITTEKDDFHELRSVESHHEMMIV